MNYFESYQNDFLYDYLYRVTDLLSCGLYNNLGVRLFESSKESDMTHVETLIESVSRTDLPCPLKEIMGIISYRTVNLMPTMS